MVVCLCAGSSDRDIERAVEAGARSLSDIGDLCRAGLDCGVCRSTLLGILHGRSCDNCPNRNGVELAFSLACSGSE